MWSILFSLTSVGTMKKTAPMEPFFSLSLSDMIILYVLDITA
jgi:hypothetical protein